MLFATRSFRVPTLFALASLTHVASLPTLAAERLNLGATLRPLGFETVELRRTGNQHLFLFGKVEGRRRSCLVDTGWSFTTISTNTATHLAQSNVIGSLALGRVRRPNVSVVTQDLRVNGQPTPYDVVLGADFLLAQQAILDCAGRRLYLRSGPLPERERTEMETRFSNAGWREVKLQRRQPFAWTCRATVKDNSLLLLVDSGATWSCIDAQTAETLKLRATPSLTRISGPAAGLAKFVAVTEFRDWRLDDHEQARTSFAVMNLKRLGLGPEGALFPEVAGILGATELTAMEAVIDCAAGKLWLRKRN